ncbi:sensor histidine kinase [Egibacter rhizosphaerae]|uniref:sensor histidine kinase n=1 Tax=Egibacter rhizosphaerae TaxID=1670831 RepID=UPI00197A7F1B|nr:sensor histidine kinase [Egibacter rhizosphaerae]
MGGHAERHLPPRQWRAYGDGVDAATTERFGALAGLIASAAVGVPVLLEFLAGTVRSPGWIVWLWWGCYLGYLAAFALLGQVPADRRPAWLADRPLLAVQVTLGALAYAFAPADGWALVLLVVTAAAAAYVLPKRGTIAVVVVQMLLIAGVTFRTEDDPLNAAVSVVVFTSFQAFAVLVIWSQQRETAARARLADAHAELRAATTLLEASSRTGERLRIARDLHDVVGHHLTALILELESATQAEPTSDSSHVGRARDIARSLLGAVRGAVTDLRDQPPALQDALADVTRLPHLRIELSVEDGLDIDDATSLALVRCVQEVVTNTVRHAEATTLSIEIGHDGNGAVLLDARDDGKGTARLRPGSGLNGVTERIDALGGSVEFVTAPGRGMRIAARIPLR